MLIVRQKVWSIWLHVMVVTCGMLEKLCKNLIVYLTGTELGSNIHVNIVIVPS